MFSHPETMPDSSVPKTAKSPSCIASFSSHFYPLAREKSQSSGTMSQGKSYSPRYLSMTIRVAVVPSLEVTYTGESYSGARRLLPLGGSLQRRNFCGSHGPGRTGGWRTVASPEDQCASLFFRGGRTGEIYMLDLKGAVYLLAPGSK